MENLKYSSKILFIWFTGFSTTCCRGVEVMVVLLALTKSRESQPGHLTANLTTLRCQSMFFYPNIIQTLLRHSKSSLTALASFCVVALFLKLNCRTMSSNTVDARCGRPLFYVQSII
ncbi:hypothetical protein BDZ45DRAFT_242716 [Acephala macrosclerotiorum]|nr:hypothetical protein BDZ45DRAFT_242716 [Acephala macrosclerotiorum]